MKNSSLEQFYLKLKPFGFLFNLGAFFCVFVLGFLTLSVMIVGGQLALRSSVMKKKLEIFDSISRSRPNAPSPERYEFLKKEAEAFAPLKESIQEKSFFWRKFNYEDRERLEFKEVLYACSQGLGKMAKSHEVTFEKSAELPLFDEELPERGELPKLFMALELNEELRKNLIDSGTSYVHELNFPTAKVEDFGADMKRYSFTSIARLNTNWSSLVTFLRGMAESKNLWRIEHMAVDNRPLDKQELEKIIAAAVVKEEKKVEKKSETVQNTPALPPDAPLRVSLVITGTYYANEGSLESAGKP